MAMAVANALVVVVLVVVVVVDYASDVYCHYYFEEEYYKYGPFQDNYHRFQKRSAAASSVAVSLVVMSSEYTL